MCIKEDDKTCETNITLNINMVKDKYKPYVTKLNKNFVSEQMDMANIGQIIISLEEVLKEDELLKFKKLSLQNPDEKVRNCLIVLIGSLCKEIITLKKETEFLNSPDN